MSGALVEVFGCGALVVVVVDTVDGAGGLVEVVHEAGTGAFVVVDSDALHVSPHLSGGMEKMPWWL